VTHVITARVARLVISFSLSPDGGRYAIAITVRLKADATEDSSRFISAGRIRGMGVVANGSVAVASRRMEVLIGKERVASGMETTPEPPRESDRC
jgi:hypothetical protein